LETWTEKQRKGLVAAAQGKSLACSSAKVVIAAEGNILHLRAVVTIEDVNELLNELDGRKPAEPTSPPTIPRPQGLARRRARELLELDAMAKKIEKAAEKAEKKPEKKPVERKQVARPAKPRRA